MAGLLPDWLIVHHPAETAVAADQEAAFHPLCNLRVEDVHTQNQAAMDASEHVEVGVHVVDAVVVEANSAQTLGAFFFCVKCGGQGPNSKADLGRPELQVWSPRVWETAAVGSPASEAH